ncbi:MULTISPECIES: RNA-guided endonuclease IscB [unclassified Streptomyces]|uniref:RNA-guided endonuclease IscB n=1 Tax=unclassified Streptomyces TaxID=2593676 RepID=UPI002E19816D
MATFPMGEQTYPGVLPQRRAPESVGADNPGSRDETAHGHPAAPPRDTGREHGRGETVGHGTRARRRHADQAETGSGDAPTPQNYEGGYGAGRVFVLAKDGQPLMPCHPARARELLRKGRAVVVRQVPFVIRLKDRTRSDSVVEGVQLRIDPGSKGSGIVLTDEKRKACGPEAATVRRGLLSAELRHRGDRISHAMRQRAGYRRRRRSANLRYRARRSANRAHPDGWHPPSLRHRVDTITSIASRFCRYAPVTEIHIETTTFDTHSMSVGRQLYGSEYQQGALAGVGTRGYLCTRWSRTCAYCGAANVPLNIEHVRPRSHGGSARIANLVLACAPCNQAKGSRVVTTFLSHAPERSAEIVAQLKPSLRDAAAMNSIQPGLYRALHRLAVPIRPWPSKVTSDNRRAVGLDKTHTLDALAVEPLDQGRGDTIVRVPDRVLVIEATGRGSYARTTPDRFGFPRLRRERRKQHFGYVTGDLVRAEIPKGKWAGTWTGRVSVRARGQHSLTTPGGRINVSYLHLHLLQRADGYAYSSRQEAGASMSRKIG